MTTGAVAAAAGFLLGVLWMDLMFDSQVRTGRGVLDEAVLSSIAGYYHRATTGSRPRGALIAVVMASLLGLLGVEAVAGDSPRWLLVPSAVRLGARRDDAGEQSRLARAIYRDHLVCLAGISAFLALWLIGVLGLRN